MIFPPLIFFLMVAFFLTALFMLPLLILGLIGEAFLRLGISPALIFWLLIITLVGSLVNIPIHTFENRQLVGEQVVSYFGMRFRVPRQERAQASILAVNVGGALIPLALSVYLISQINFGVSLPILLVVLFGADFLTLSTGFALHGIVVIGIIPLMFRWAWAAPWCEPECSRSRFPEAPTAPR
jgi:uncharacterized membrane protein